jgi:quercetin dioxygenase-like cupin family protein
MDNDAVSAAPEVYSVVFENERVRVLDVRADPGAGSPMHGHPDFVRFAVRDAHIVVASPDGREQRADVPAGAVFWNAATVHAVENVGDEPLHFIRIELK